jgi:type II secretory pathway pseudopilin PulG
MVEQPMNRNKGMALAEMLVALVIVMLLAYLYMKLVWKNSAGIDQKTKKALAEQGIKTDNPQNVVQSAQETVNRFNKKTAASQPNYDTTQ